MICIEWDLLNTRFVMLSGRYGFIVVKGSQVRFQPSILIIK